MAEEKKEVKKEAKKVEEPELLNRPYTDGDGKEYFWTKKSGMTEPIKVYK
jgi:hypothetical protein